MCFAIGATLIGKIAMGLSVAKGVSDTLGSINQAKAGQERDSLSQIMQLRQYTADREARDRDARHQMEQISNQEIEAKENAEDQKGDIALAAQAASSKLAASQASSGLQVGMGSFGSLLQSIGFEAARDTGDVDANLKNRNVQIESEKRGNKAANQVPAPFLPEIAPVNTGMMLLGGGLQIASGVAGRLHKNAKLDDKGKAWGHPE